MILAIGFHGEADRSQQFEESILFGNFAVGSATFPDNVFPTRNVKLDLGFPEFQFGFRVC